MGFGTPDTPGEAYDDAARFLDNAADADEEDNPDAAAMYRKVAQAYEKMGDLLANGEGIPENLSKIARTYDDAGDSFRYAKKAHKFSRKAEEEQRPDVAAMYRKAAEAHKKTAESFNA